MSPDPASARGAVAVAGAMPSPRGKTGRGMTRVRSCLDVGPLWGVVGLNDGVPAFPLRLGPAGR
ncbi:protein of unknown function [Methylorubrum extorquens]|uniref:Uncharacterized protein n=1 Tax=Methylorubrum extorquens TaxID=408 RepID=A0A2N9AW14_METEX|nr:protein of unknown function [Methylorubrum extorquens]